MVQHLIPELSAIRDTNVEGPALDIEPSAIRALSVEGPALDIEPSTIQALSVEGSTLEPRTIRDIGTNRGRFAPGY